MIEAYIDNAGKYAEGKAYGDWLKFPTNTEQVQSLLSRIGVDGVNYQEVFFTDYKTDISGLGHLGEFESIDELNYLSSLLADLEDWELEKFSAVAVCSDYAGSARDLINLAQNLERYEYYPGVKGEEELGRYLINELEYEKIPDHLVDYFDYESYASDHVINEDGHFVKGGFVCRNQGVYFIEHYTGRDDIPDEYAHAPPGKSANGKSAAQRQGPITISAKRRGIILS
jgi:antirestriction protein